MIYDICAACVCACICVSKDFVPNSLNPWPNIGPRTPPSANPPQHSFNIALGAMRVWKPVALFAPLVLLETRSRYDSAQAKSMALVKHEDKVKELGGENGKPLSTFHEYNLDALEIPIDARPCAGQHHAGRHGYTLHLACGAVAYLVRQKYVYCMSRLVPPNVILEPSHSRPWKRVFVWLSPPWQRARITTTKILKSYPKTYH